MLDTWMLGTFLWPQTDTYSPLPPTLLLKCAVGSSKCFQGNCQLHLEGTSWCQLLENEDCVPRQKLAPGKAWLQEAGEG